MTFPWWLNVSFLPWWLASLMSNVAIIYIEYMNRSTTSGWLSVLSYTFLPICFAQWCLFRGFNGAPHWLIAWTVFALGNTAMRIVAVQTLAGHEVKSWTYTMSGVTVILLGSWLVKLGMK